MYGKEGIGKKEFAKEFAKKILCLKNEINCTCKSCLEFETNNNPDFLILESEDSTIKIEQIRNLLTKCIEKPIISSKKIYIINNAETMTKEAQNCLLKTLEEPPEFLIIILIVQNESEIINTIKSRCTKILFNPIKNIELKQYLENQNIYDDLSEEKLNSFEGSIKKALNWKKNEELYKQIKEFFDKIEKSDIIELLNNQNIIYKNKENILDVISYMNILYYQKIKKIENIDLITKYIKCIEILEKTKKKLNSNANFDMCIDNMFLLIYDVMN